MRYSKVLKDDKIFRGRREQVVRFTSTKGKKINIDDIVQILAKIEDTDPDALTMVRGGSITGQFRTLKGYRQPDLLSEDEYLDGRVRETEPFNEFYYIDIYLSRKV